MRRTALLLLLGLSTLAAGQDPAPERGPAEAQRQAMAQLRRLGWLQGTWVLQDGAVTTEEHWRPLQGTTMLGLSHAFDAERTRWFEFLRLGLGQDRVVYVAMPGGGAAVTFALTRLEDGMVEFENPAHDHPQRIRYEKTAPGLRATICQLDGSRATTFDFKPK